jgi:hypothetical protein
MGVIERKKIGNKDKEVLVSLGLLLKKKDIYNSLSASKTQFKT